MAVSEVSTNSAVWNDIATEIESGPIASIPEKSFHRSNRLGYFA
jgi:hypothetical protein